MWFDMVGFGGVVYDLMGCGVAWCGMVWYDIVPPSFHSSLLPPFPPSTLPFFHPFNLRPSHPSGPAYSTAHSSPPGTLEERQNAAAEELPC